MSHSLIIIPTYNEKENILRIIPLVLAVHPEFHVLIIDDNSPDGTAALLKQALPQFSGRVFLEERKGKLGLGTAYIHGFKWALARDYEFIFEMDCDFSHPPASLLDLLKACQTDGADVAVGSRYVKGGKVVNWPWDRIAMSYGASLYVRLITFMPVKDTTAGFVCYRRKVLETINLDAIQFIGYAFQIEMKYKAWLSKFKIVEVPITFIDRVDGVSKMSKGIFKEAMLGVLKLRSDAFLGKKV